MTDAASILLAAHIAKRLREKIQVPDIEPNTHSMSTGELQLIAEILERKAPPANTVKPAADWLPAQNDNPGRGCATTNDLAELERILDPEVKELVFLLLKNGFETFMSCSGKAGHAFSAPTIKMFHKASEERLNKERNRLDAFLDNEGYRHYFLRQVYEWHGSMGYLELEFYRLGDLLKRPV